ncbi:hypothetical protein [Streptomyces chartreusis]|uniref:hypothetical protein n=1 Tax=Streptomyces chartreusis TaxID=1969 RepID=UPI002E17A71F
MQDSPTLQTQYEEKVAEDLRANTDEQKRIRTEVAVLEEQLATLEHERVMLENMRQTLTGSTPASDGLPQKTDPRSVAATVLPGQAVPASAGRTTLRELVLAYLRAQEGPSVAADVTTTLTEEHPDRKIGATVVRNTLEALVARGDALRDKQGKSVFYTAAVREPAHA